MLPVLLAGRLVGRGEPQILQFANRVDQHERCIGRYLSTIHLQGCQVLFFFPMRTDFYSLGKGTDLHSRVLIGTNGSMGQAVPLVACRLLIKLLSRI